MADVVVLGGGPAGLGSAMLLAKRGLDVVVLDRDGPPPADPDAAWESWEKKSIGQFRLVHFLQPAGRALIEEHLPSVYSELQVLEWFQEVIGCYALPDEVIAREGVLDRVLEVALSNPPYASPGPNRAELEAILVG